MLFLSQIFARLTDLRSFLNEFGISHSFKCSLPVVCVGNAVVGGAGKTPVVAWLFRELSARGFAPVVLSRGYMGSVPGPHRCRLADRAGLIGDEAALLVRSGCEVIVSKNKVAGAKFIEGEKRWNVIILDDGFQHLRLARDCNVLVIPESNKLAEQTFPGGRLRESYHTALRRADVALISRKSSNSGDAEKELAASIRANFPAVPIASSSYSKPRIFDSEGREISSCYEVCLVTAVANPEGVRATALASGVKIVSEHIFRDHHHYTLAEIQKIQRGLNIPLLVTEKDAVKLKDLGLSDFYVLKIELSVSGPLIDQVLARIEGRTREEREKGALCDQILAASPLKRQKVVQLQRVCRDLKGNILDLGCDNGAVSLALRRLGGSWKTGDLDAEVVKGAGFFLGDSVNEIDPRRLNFESNSLDAVVVIDMFEHLDDDAALRSELQRVLKPGGQLIVNVPNPYPGLIRFLRGLLGQDDKVHGHLRPGYSLQQLRRLLGEGFRVEQVVPYSRAFTELADTAVTFGVDLLKSAKRSSVKGRVVSVADTASLTKALKLGKLVAPFLNLALVFDYLLPWSAANLLIVRARKL